MAYEITPHDFCLIVKNPKCKGTETNNGTAKEGHSNCDWCKGNYFVGGECNYGGRHKMADDLRQINQNFRAFDTLVKQQVKLSKSKSESEFNNSKKALLNSFKSLKEKCEDEGGAGFFYGSCIGLDGDKSIFATRIKETFKRLARELGYYMTQIENSTWQQLAAFQEKLKKLDKLNSEATQLTKEWKEETDPIKKAQLFALLSQKNNEIKSLQAELKKDPVYSLYSQEKNDELANIVKNIFHGSPNTSFFNWKKKGSDNNKEEPKSEKYLGFIDKETGKNALLIVGGLLGLLLIWWFIKRKFKK